MKKKKKIKESESIGVEKCWPWAEMGFPFPISLSTWLDDPSFTVYSKAESCPSSGSTALPSSPQFL